MCYCARAPAWACWRPAGAANQGSGLGVLAACRDRASEQKMVVLSNYATPDVRMRCAQLGVDAVFDKSNEIDALVDYCIAHGTQRAAAAGAPVNRSACS